MNEKIGGCAQIYYQTNNALFHSELESSSVQVLALNANTNPYFDVKNYGKVFTTFRL